MQDHEITASWDTLLSQSFMTANDALRRAIEATENLPEGVDRTALIVAHMRASSADFQSASISIAAQRLCRSLDDVAVAIGGLGQ